MDRVTRGEEVLSLEVFFFSFLAVISIRLCLPYVFKG